MSIETSKTESEKKKEWKRQNRVSKNHGTTAEDRHNRNNKRRRKKDREEIVEVNGSDFSKINDRHTTADPETSLKMSGINIKKSSPCIS